MPGRNPARAVHTPWPNRGNRAATLGPRLARLVIAALVSAATTGTAAQTLSGVASSIDRDILEVHGQRIRLHGIDAPESRQQCRKPEGGFWRCGQQASLALSDRVYAVSMKDRTGPFFLTLFQDRKVNGYYLVRVPGRHNESGWIYKSYVRRFERAHPDYIPYARKQYSHWIDEDHDCQDAWQEALIRDSTSAALFADASECKVANGQWYDPYSGRSFDDPKLLDIDHFVPLKNAHESGAWTWSPEKKQRYANYLADEYHLLAVSASENRRKADKGPDRYMPPNRDFHCDYVRIWV